MSLIEFCVWKYKLDIIELMSRPQGVSKELEAAEEKIEQIQSDMKKIRKYKKKWDGRVPIEHGAKKIIYDQDMKILSLAEVLYILYISLHSLFLSQYTNNK